MGEKWKQGIDALIRRMAEGDEEALAQLIRQTQSHILSEVRKRTSSLPEEEVESLANYVYSNAYRFAGGYTGRSKYGNAPDEAGWQWLRTAARNATMSEFRTRSFKGQRLETSEADLPRDPEEDEVEDPLDQVADEESIPFETFLAGLQGLHEIQALLTGEEYRILEWLAEGYSQREIAGKLGMTPQAVCLKIKTIRRKLAEYSAHRK